VTATGVSLLGCHTFDVSTTRSDGFVSGSFICLLGGSDSVILDELMPIVTLRTISEGRHPGVLMPKDFLCIRNARS
jgi:hypothetical protein